MQSLSSALPVRPLEDGPLLDAFYHLATGTFASPVSVEEEAAATRRFDEDETRAGVLHRRGALEDGELLGGYLIHERPMRMGPALLPTACVGAVVTHPRHRGRGVGRALMEDAVTFAQQRGLALLLLDGIPNFYHRFGYVDVFDETRHVIDRRLIPPEPVPGYHVRQATVQDDVALFDLYRRHQGAYAGSFDWTPEQARRRLLHRIERGRPPAVAEEGSGTVRGYLYARAGTNRAPEVAADTWPAALALLQHHDRVVPGDANALPELWWRLPPDAHTVYLLAEHLPGDPGERREDRVYPVRSVVTQYRYEGWMARPAHLPSLLHALLPLWTERWRRSDKPYKGEIELRIGDDTLPISFTHDGIRARASLAVRTSVGLSPQAFTQILFGFRPVRWIASQPDQEVPRALWPALEVLFPPGTFWIAGSDAF